MQPEFYLTRDEARYVSLVAQRLEHLSKPPRSKPDKARILETIQALGCVQLDTISVVARSHETVLWSRLGPYDPALIRELHYPDKELIEYWVHAAAIAPVGMYPYLRRYMQHHHHDQPHNDENWEGENRELIQSVLAAIAERGPSLSRTFDRPEGPRAQPWAWYGGKPAKQALDAAWTAGELVIQQRVGFQRMYELTDRAFPGLRTEPWPSIEAQQRFFVLTALNAMGVATARWAADYFRGGKAHVSVMNTIEELRSLETDGFAIPITVTDLNERAWLSTNLLPALEAHRSGRARPKRTTLLSPFDSLVWNRDRALKLFDFDYRIECYTPMEKRRYGYYTLPILHRGKLVGRLDPVYKRAEKRLIVNSVHLEPGVRPNDRLARAVNASLQSYLTFIGGGRIDPREAGDGEFMRLLKKDLDKNEI